ncbi:MAG: hypothetical protein LBG12_15260 [Synergistaceae bacterium]|nr:hypothetical protein [Synergistaceae bacterium]
MSFKSFIMSAVLVCVCAASCAAADSWKEIQERGDFRIDDRNAVLERAYEEITNIYGQEFDIESLKNAKSYVNAVHSEKYNADVAAVLIEDRDAGEADCYYEIAFELPALDCMIVGSVWIDGTLDEYLDSLLYSIYEEIDEDVPENANGDMQESDGLE